MAKAPFDLEEYKKALDKTAQGHIQQDQNNMVPPLWDMDRRFALMDKYGLMLGYTFFGPNHLLFGTDFPFAGLDGERAIRQTIMAIEEMDKKKASR